MRSVDYHKDNNVVLKLLIFYQDLRHGHRNKAINRGVNIKYHYMKLY